MNIPTIPAHLHKPARIAGVIFGSLVLIIGTIGTISFANQGFNPLKVYNTVMSFLLAILMILPYSKIKGIYSKPLGYTVLGVCVFHVVTSTIPGVLRMPDAAGIFGALLVGTILIPNGLIAYQILVKEVQKAK
jgi:hypothetical protein